MYECRLDIVDTVATKDLLTRLTKPLKDKTVYDLIPVAIQFDQEAFRIFRANPSFVNLFFCCCEVFGQPITLEVRHSKGLYHLRVLEIPSGKMLDKQADKYPYVALRKLIYRWKRNRP